MKWNDGQEKIILKYEKQYNKFLQCLLEFVKAKLVKLCEKL